jgi:hypothetical protein
VIGQRVGAFFGGAFLAAVLVFMGPTDLIVLRLRPALDDLYEKASGGGHIDGASVSYCEVPKPGTWIAGAIVLAAAVVAPLFIDRSKHRSPPAAA